MRVITAIDTDGEGRCWPLIQFGPVECAQEAQAMLDQMSELIAERFGSAAGKTIN